jgi:hypothetical protein
LTAIEDRILGDIGNAIRALTLRANRSMPIGSKVYRADIALGRDRAKAAVDVESC